jgi:hypothetical protein
MQEQLVGREGTGSLFDSTSETYAIVTRWLDQDAWLLGAALLLTPIALVRRRTRAVALAFVIQVAMILRPGYLPNMYVLSLLPFAALIVAGTSEALLRPWSRGSGRGAAIVAVAFALALAVAAPVVATRWIDSAEVAMTTRVDGGERAAKRWLLENVDRDDRVLLGDEYWIYLVEHGFDDSPVPGGFFSRTLVSFWTLDYDPAVQRQFPGGWRDFDYVVSTQAMRVQADETPSAARAVRNSQVVARFGHGDEAIEIRAIDEALAPG